MKKLLFAAVVLLSLQASGQCYKTVNTSMSLHFGIDKNGMTETMEFGAWGVDQPLGAYIGVVFRNHLMSGIERGKPIQYMEPFADFHLRATLKIYEDEHFYHVLTAYISVKGDAGASYRIYKPLGDHVVVGLEPSICLKAGAGLSTVFTFNF